MTAPRHRHPARPVLPYRTPLPPDVLRLAARAHVAPSGRPAAAAAMAARYAVRRVAQVAAQRQPAAAPHACVVGGCPLPAEPPDGPFCPEHGWDDAERARTVDSSCSPEGGRP